jgi:hypothetical protein
MKKAVITILLVTALLFGFTTCDGPFTDPNTFDNGMGGGGGGGLGGLGGMLSFKKGTPPSSSGLSSAQFNAINKAAGGGYKGYSFMSMPMGKSAGGAGDGYQGYSGADNTNSRASYGSIGILYACWENRQSGNFASMVQEAEIQTGVKCNVSVNFNNATWYESLTGTGGQYSSYLGDVNFGDFYVAVGISVASQVYKVWWLMWVKSDNSYLGASFKKGDLLFVYMDLTEYMAQYGY